MAQLEGLVVPRHQQQWWVASGEWHCCPQGFQGTGPSFTPCPPGQSWAWGARDLHSLPGAEGPAEHSPNLGKLVPLQEMGKRRAVS